MKYCFVPENYDDPICGKDPEWDHFEETKYIKDVTCPECIEIIQNILLQEEAKA